MSGNSIEVFTGRLRLSGRLTGTRASNGVPVKFWLSRASPL